jgi:putative ABC transport system permease protein
LILIAAAGLLLRTLANLESVPLGLDSTGVVIAKIDLAEYRYPNSTRQLAFFNELEQRLHHLPGTQHLAIADTLPPSGAMQATFFSSIEIPGHPKFREGTGGMIGYRHVTPNYFPALGIPIRSGRAFREEDRAPATNPVIVSETLARRLFPCGENPVGLQFRFGSQETWRTIVGVAADVKNNGVIEAADPEFYIPWKDDPAGYFRSAQVIVQTALSASTVAPWLRSEVAAVDPAVPVTVESLRTRVGKLADRPRFNAVLLSLFALIAVLLAAIGIYGVVAFLVGQQTREIGVRMALGAAPGQILRMVLTTVARWTAAGAALGLLGAWFSSRLIESLLFHVRAHDPLLLAASLAFLLAVSLTAAWIPARRAMRLDPLVALRYE